MDIWTIAAVLSLGIIFILLIFGWLLRRKGYSKRARLWGGSWSFFILILALCAETPLIDSNAQKAGINQAKIISEKMEPEPLPFNIISLEPVKKGGGDYVLLVVNATLSSEDYQLTEEKIENTLNIILEDIRVKGRNESIIFHAITAYLYLSREHHANGNSAIAMAEWRPKDRSLSYENATNIENKATYVQSVNVMHVPFEPEDIVSRLPINIRKEIFAASILIERRAEKEAEQKFPTEHDHIPSDKLESYDFKLAASNYVHEAERLENKYMRELINKYKTTESELRSIGIEGVSQRWLIKK